MATKHQCEAGFDLPADGGKCPQCGATSSQNCGVWVSQTTKLVDGLRAAATRWPRCCDLWQDSLGGMHCTECAQKTFAMMREIQELLGVDKGCNPVSPAKAA
jgi:hypothetical protein